MVERGKLIRLPMMFVDGQWVLEYGGDLPVGHGARGELLVEAQAVPDCAEKELFLCGERFEILPEGTPLLAIMEVRDPSSIGDEQAKLLIPWEEVRPQCSSAPFTGSSRYLRAVEVRVARATERQLAYDPAATGGLWLATEGMSPVGLISSTIEVPSCVSARPAQSLNHAYTLLSQVFETWRRSHTGSVNRRVLYQEEDGLWYPLRRLRDKHVARQSHRIANDLWKQVMARHASQMA